jgi:DNA-binding MarR family transcriptional regulator
MHDDDPRLPLPAAISVRRGVLSLGRRLRLERSTARLTALELGVLGHLRRRGPLSPGDLAAAERVQPQSLTRTLASLQARGLTLREPDPADGRRSVLAMTDAGLAALRVEMGQRDAWLAAVMSAKLASAEIGLLQLAGELMERLADAE